MIMKFMNTLFKCGVCLSVSVVLFSCEKSSAKKVIYYPVDSLVYAQVMFLKEQQAVLTKKAEIDGTEESSSFTPKDSAAWARELDIFAELGVINRPGNAKSYAVKRGEPDPNSNLSILSFTGDEETLPVVYLKAFYLETPSRLRRIEALYREENSLLKGSRLLILEFQEIHNKIALTSYSIEGSQQMFLGKSVKFSVRGTIAIP